MKTNIGNLILLASLSCASSLGQQDSRTDEIEAARSQKEQNLQPPEDPTLENVIVDAEKNIIYRLFTSTDGPGIGFGQMVPGAGFSLNLRYQKTLLNGHLHLAGYLDGSTKRYYLARFNASLLDLWDGHAVVDFSTTHSFFTQMPYYGPGPESRKTGRSDYRLERTDVEIRPALRPIRHLRVGLLGGFIANNVGSGTASQYISTEKQFDPSVTPGILQQTNYLQGGGFVDYDWRNDPAYPLSGGQYKAEYAKLSDRDVGLYSFYRVNLDAREYIPLFHRKRVIALHGATWLTDTNRTQQVPFYMQPTLGGPDTLRGFEPFRFYDDNAVLIQGEYRWEASTILDLALFADGGKVFHDWDQWNLHKIEGDFGFGLRFKTQSRLALRIDTGFSHEGFQVCFRAENPF